MDIKHVVPAHVVPHLADGFEERLSLDIAHRAPHLDENYLRLGLIC